jgi:uncharacterized protein (DUF169 family)
MTTEHTGEAGDQPTGRGEDTVWDSLGSALVSALHLPVPPVGITFCDDEQPEVPRFDVPLSAPADDGRRGRVAAGCVFWVHGAERSFSTEAEDHGNCSVGQLTHGLAALADVAGHDDVGALIGSGWVDDAAIGSVPRVQTRHRFVIYGPLGRTGVAPDVVLIRVNGRQMMVMHDAVPAMSIEGKPQCHIVALAHEHGQVAASVGCALSRPRTGMRPEEMTCAIPGPRLAEVVAAVQRTGEVDTLVATYAARDARRSA